MPQPRSSPPRNPQPLCVRFDIRAWQGAQLLIRNHGADAALHAALRVHDELSAGDIVAAANWKHVLNAIEELQRVRPLPGQLIN